MRSVKLYRRGGIRLEEDIPDPDPCVEREETGTVDEKKSLLV